MKRTASTKSGSAEVTRRERWTVLVAVLAVTGLTVGCGGDGGEDPEQLNLEQTQISAAGVNPSVAMGPDGRFAVTWSKPDPSGAPRMLGQMQRFTAGGFKDGSVVTVWQSPANNFSTDQAIAVVPQGESFVAFYSGSISVQRNAADGSPLGAASLVSSGPGLLLLTAMDVGPGGQGVVLWYGGRDQLKLVARRLAADGSAAGPELIVDQDVSKTSRGFPASTAVLADGSFVVCWGGPGGVGSSQFQRFAPDGTPVGGWVSIDLLAGQRIAVPRVDAVPGGGFVVMWQYGGSNGSSNEGQRFAADGSPLGGRFTMPPSDTLGFSVGPDGSMVVVWTVDNGPGPLIRAQRLAADATPKGAQISVTSTPGAVYLSSVALGPGGRFFAVWQDGPEVRGRLFVE